MFQFRCVGRALRSTKEGSTVRQTLEIGLYFAGPRSVKYLYPLHTRHSIVVTSQPPQLPVAPSQQALGGGCKLRVAVQTHGFTRGWIAGAVHGGAEDLQTARSADTLQDPTGRPAKLDTIRRCLAEDICRPTWP